VTDYTKTSGTTGKMMIRDTGTDVEFWFKAGYSSDWWNGMPFNWTANGTTTSRSINYPTGADWYKVGEVRITDSQTVTFRLTDGHSSSGIGGPTSFPQAIARDTRPAKPTTPNISNVTATSVYVTFSDGFNGGDPIDTRRIAYATTGTTPGYPDTGYETVPSDRSTTIGGLTPGETYYFWASTHNSEGWSLWSGRASVTTLRTPSAPSAPLLSSVRATSVEVAFSAPGNNGGSTITGYQLGYGVSYSAPTTIISAISPRIVQGLNPGTLYYFWVRARNAVGWGPWSAFRSIKTVAGAYIKVGAVTKLAIPYVKVDGVWEIAEPWVKTVGVWKRTT
jgi:hypothetical protein